VSNENTERRYWIWGQFDEASSSILNKTQRIVHDELQGPSFILHLTLSGPFFDLSPSTLERIDTFALKNKQFSIKPRAYGMKDLFFQSLFVEIENTHKLNTLKMNLDDLLEVSSEDFFPHISLFYGLKNKAVKQAVIDHLLTLPEYIVLDKITIAETGQGDIESWKIVRQYPLINNLNVLNSLGRPI
jgi:hypothetical protein